MALRKCIRCHWKAPERLALRVHKMTANPWRGEVEIMLGGKPYILRPTFSSLSNIEQQLGLGLVALARKLADGSIRLEELAVIIAQCSLEAPLDIRQALARGGLAHVIASVSRMLAVVFGGLDEAGA